MVGEGVEASCCTDETAGCGNDIAHHEEQTDELLEPDAAHDEGHVRNGMAADMVLAEVAQYNGAICVDGAPGHDDDGSGEGAEAVEGRRDTENSCRKDDCTTTRSLITHPQPFPWVCLPTFHEDHSRRDPADRSKVHRPFCLLEHLEVLIDAFDLAGLDTPAAAGSRPNRVHVRLL